MICGVEVQPLITLKRRILPTDPVHQADELFQTIVPLDIPLCDLVLLRIEILLTPLLQRTVLAQFKSGAIDPIARA